MMEATSEKKEKMAKKQKMKKQKENRKTSSMLKKQVLWNIAAIAFILLVLNAAVQLKPGNIHTTNSSVRLEWTGLASYALVDENPGFVSPVRAEKSAELQLKPGTYYWCVPFMGKCIFKHKFVVDSEVAVTAEKILQGKENASYKIENKGNIPIGLTIKKAIGGIITGFATIETGESEIITINETSAFIAAENE